MKKKFVDLTSILYAPPVDKQSFNYFGSSLKSTSRRINFHISRLKRACEHQEKVPHFRGYELGYKRKRRDGKIIKNRKKKRRKKEVKKKVKKKVKRGGKAEKEEKKLQYEPHTYKPYKSHVQIGKFFKNLDPNLKEARVVAPPYWHVSFEKIEWHYVNRQCLINGVGIYELCAKRWEESKEMIDKLMKLPNRESIDIYRYCRDIVTYGGDKLYMGVICKSDIKVPKFRPDRLSWYQKILARKNNYHYQLDVERRILKSDPDERLFTEKIILTGQLNNVICIEFIEELEQIIAAGGDPPIDPNFQKAQIKPLLVSYDMKRIQKDGKPKTEILVGSSSCVADMKIARWENEPIIISACHGGEVIAYKHTYNFYNTGKQKWWIYHRFDEKEAKVKYNWVIVPKEQSPYVYACDDHGILNLCDLKEKTRTEYLVCNDGGQPWDKSIDEIIMNEYTNEIYCMHQYNDSGCGYINIFDMATTSMKPLKILDERDGTVQQFAINKRNEDVLIGGMNARVSLYHKDGTKETLMTGGTYFDMVHSVSFASDVNPFLLQFTAGNVQFLFDTRNSKGPIQIFVNEHEINYGCFSKKRDWICQAAEDFRVYDFFQKKYIVNEKCIQQFEFINFFHDDTVCFTGARDTDVLKIWTDKKKMNYWKRLSGIEVKDCDFILDDNLF